MRIKAKLGGSSSYDTDSFLNKRAVLPISVNQPYHENDKFNATIAMVNKRFGYCDIVVADTLQRYNFFYGKEYSIEELYKISKNEGDNWLKRNSRYLNLLSVPHSIIRWDDCIQLPTFPLFLNKIKDRYLHDPAYRDAFKQDIDVFLTRYLQHNTRDNHDVVKNIEASCLAYLFEENAVVLSCFVENTYHFILYPSKIPKSVSMSRDIFATNTPELVQHLKIYFKACTPLPHST